MNARFHKVFVTKYEELCYSVSSLVVIHVRRFYRPFFCLYIVQNFYSTFQSFYKRIYITFTCEKIHSYIYNLKKICIALN